MIKRYDTRFWRFFALFALIVQIVAASGHVHFSDEALASHESDVAACDFAIEDACPSPDREHNEGACLVCLAAHQLASGVAAAPVDVSVACNAVERLVPPARTTLGEHAPAANYDARGPPQV